MHAHTPPHTHTPRQPRAITEGGAAPTRPACAPVLGVEEETEVQGARDVAGVWGARRRVCRGEGALAPKDPCSRI